MGFKILKNTAVFTIQVAILVIVASIAAPEIAFSASSTKNQTEYWADTGLSDSQIKELLSQERCYANESSFVGCIAAINAILEVGYPKKILTNKSIENMMMIGDVVSNIQRLKIQKLKNPASLDDQRIMNQSWASIYKLTTTNRIFLEKILDKALSLTTQKSRSMKVAYAINQYYKNALDPHTYLIAVKARENELNTSESSIIGIGITIRKIDNGIIIQPKTGSPAFAAGIKPMDILLKVDGDDVGNAPIDDVVNKIRGEENTNVNITVYRQGKSLSFDVARARFIEKNLEVQIMNDPIGKSRIAYIKLATFNEIGLCEKFIASAIALHDKNTKSLVLDLRGNGGGLVSEAKCIASNFIENGKIIFTENDPVTNKIKIIHRSEKHNAAIYNLYGKKPLVILIDHDSASASEMVSGALRAYNRAILIGERSFGKGTIQSQIEWKEDGLNTLSLKGIAIMKTVSRFHFANGESNQQVGLTPDIEADTKIPPPEALRETDLYSNAISSVPIKPYTTSSMAHSVQACITQRNMLGSAYADKINSHLVLDYPMSIAREAASCP